MTSLSLMLGMPYSTSLHVDLAVVAHHQPERTRALLGAGHDRLAPDEAVLEARDVHDAAAVHDHRMLDLRVGHLAVGAAGTERAHEAVHNAGAGADGHRAADGGPDDLGARGDHHSPVD